MSGWGPWVVCLFEYAKDLRADWFGKRGCGILCDGLDSEASLASAAYEWVSSLFQESSNVALRAEECRNMKWLEVSGVANPVSDLYHVTGQGNCVHRQFVTCLKIGAVQSQSLHCAQVSTSSGKEQGRVAIVVCLIDITPTCDETLDYVRVATVSSRYKGRQASLIALIEASAVVQYPLNKVLVAAIAREQKGRVTVVGAVIKTAPVGNKPRYQVLMATARC